MKDNYLFKLTLCLGFLLINVQTLSAQRIAHLPEHNFLSAYTIEVAFDKTTHLIFPYQIIYVDLGSTGIIADKVERVENILKVKANQRDFKPTNLTVVTSSGNFYSFLVSYSEKPEEVNIVLNKSGTASTSPSELLASIAATSSPAPVTEKEGDLPGEPMAIFEKIRLNQKELDDMSRKIIRSKRSVKDLGAVEHNMSFATNGIYIKDNAFFFHLFFENRSNINFDIESIRFYIKDKKVPKRTATQEDEIFPLYTFNERVNTIPGKMKADRVYVMEKFTIPDDKVLMVELFEKSGGRNMSFVVNNEDIIKAKLLK